MKWFLWELIALVCSCTLANAQDTTVSLVPTWSVLGGRHTVLVTDSGRTVFISDNGRNLEVRRADDGNLVESVTLDTTYAKLAVSGDGSMLFGFLFVNKGLLVDRYSTQTWTRYGRRIPFNGDNIFGVVPFFSDSMLLVVQHHDIPQKYAQIDASMYWLNLNTGGFDMRRGYGYAIGNLDYAPNPWQKTVNFPAWYLETTDYPTMVQRLNHLSLGESAKEVQAKAYGSLGIFSVNYQYDKTFSRTIIDNSYYIMSSSRVLAPLKNIGQYSTTALPSWLNCLRWFSKAELVFDIIDSWTGARIAEAKISGDTLRRTVHNPWDAKVFFTSAKGLTYCFNLKEIDELPKKYDCSMVNLPDSIVVLSILNLQYEGPTKPGQTVKWFMNDTYLGTGASGNVVFKTHGLTVVKGILFENDSSTVPLCVVEDTVMVSPLQHQDYYSNIPNNALAVFAPHIDQEIFVYTAFGTYSYAADTSKKGALKSLSYLFNKGLASTSNDVLYWTVRGRVFPPVDSARYLVLDKMSHGQVDSVGVKLWLPSGLSNQYLLLGYAYGRYHAPTGRTVWHMVFGSSPSGSFSGKYDQFSVALVTEPNGKDHVTKFYKLNCSISDLHGSTQYLQSLEAPYELDLETLDIERVRGIKVRVVGECFPARGLFSNCGILYQKRDSLWALADTIPFGCGVMSHTPENNPNISLVTMGYSGPTYTFGIFHKPTRTMSLRVKGWFGDAEASTITKNGEYIFISTREKKLGVYRVPLSPTTSVAQPESDRKAYELFDNSQSPLPNIAVESTTQIRIPPGTKSVEVYSTRGLAIARVDFESGLERVMPELNLARGVYAFTYCVAGGVRVQLVHVVR